MNTCQVHAHTTSTSPRPLYFLPPTRSERTNHRVLHLPHHNSLLTTTHCSIRRDFGYKSPTRRTTSTCDFGHQSLTHCTILRRDFGYKSPTRRTTSTCDFGQSIPDALYNLPRDIRFKSPTRRKMCDSGINPRRTVQLKTRLGFKSPTRSMHKTLHKAPLLKHSAF